VYRETVSHFESKKLFPITYDFRLPREVDEICDFLGYYAASNRNSLLKFRENLTVPSYRVKHLLILIFEDGADKLSRNVGKEFPEDRSSYKALCSPDRICYCTGT